MPKMSLEYNGELKIHLKSKNGTQLLGGAHNNGYDPLFKIFAKLLAGVEVDSKELPTSLDIRYKFGGEYISCLISHIDINKKYGYIDDKYMTIIEAMVPYSSFVSDILVGFSEQTEFDLVLLNGDNSIMAMTTISYSYLNRIAPGTQMLIEWRMYVANPDKTTTQGE